MQINPEKTDLTAVTGVFRKHWETLEGERLETHASDRICLQSRVASVFLNSAHSPVSCRDSVAARERSLGSPAEGELRQRDVVPAEEAAAAAGAAAQEGGASRRQWPQEAEDGGPGGVVTQQSAAFSSVTNLSLKVSATWMAISPGFSFVEEFKRKWIYSLKLNFNFIGKNKSH